MPSQLAKSLRFNILFKYMNVVLSVASGILMVPFYLNYLSISEYGVWLAVGGFAVWFSAMDPGIANLIILKTSKSLGEDNKQALAAYVVCALVLSLSVAVLIMIIGYVMAPALINWTNLTAISAERSVTAFRLAVSSVAIMIFSYTMIGILQGLHKSVLAGSLVTLSAFLKIVFAITLFFFGYGFLSIPLAWVIASCAVAISSVVTLVIVLRGNISKIVIDLSILREFSILFAYSFGGRFAKTITGSVDSVMIAKFIGAEAVAAYSLTATAPRQCENIINQPIASFRPVLAHLSATAETRVMSQIISRLLFLIIWLGGWITIGLLALNELFINLWVGSAAFAGVSTSMVLALLFFLRVWSNATGAIGFSLGSIRSNSIAEWVYSVALVPALVFGAVKGGLLGLAIAHFITIALTMVWFFPYSIYKKLGWKAENLRPATKEFFLAVVAAFMAYWSRPAINDWFGLILATFAITAIYFIILFLFSKSFREFLTFRSVDWVLKLENLHDNSKP